MPAFGLSGGQHMSVGIEDGPVQLFGQTLVWQMSVGLQAPLTGSEPSGQTHLPPWQVCPSGQQRSPRTQAVGQHSPRLQSWPVGQHFLMPLPQSAQVSLLLQQAFVLVEVAQTLAAGQQIRPAQTWPDGQQIRAPVSLQT